MKTDESNDEVYPLPDDERRQNTTCTHYLLLCYPFYLYLSLYISGITYDYFVPFSSYGRRRSFVVASYYHYRAEVEVTVREYFF